ncbi:MAG: calcium/proton exchanger [Ignavibacteria bacterium]|nr:calcium/proton exchanger [Ignavibacteria bacterium]
MHFVLPNNPGIVFVFAVVAIIPLAAALGEATEHVAYHAGDAVGGLLNSTFGNLPELLILTAVLRSGLVDLVLASLYGAILVNAILATGLSMLFGGLKYHTQTFKSEHTNEFSSLLAIAVFALAVISIMSESNLGQTGGGHIAMGQASQMAGQTNDQLNLILSCLLIAGYGMFLWYSLVTHKDLHVKSRHTAETVWTLKKSMMWLIGTSIGVVWISEILTGSIELAMQEFRLNQQFTGAIVIAVIGGAAEMASAVRAARVNRMDLALTIAMGAGVQIALFVAPLLVLLSYVFASRILHLHFSLSAVLLLFMAVYIVSAISKEGKSSWYGGALLVLLYIILGVCYYY